MSEAVEIPVALLRVDLSLSALRLWAALRREVRGDKLRWPGDARLLDAMPPTTDFRTLRRAKSELLMARCLARRTDGAYVLLVPDVDEAAFVGPRILPTVPPAFEPFAALEPDLPKADPMVGFDRFWATYPHKRGKDAAARAWRLKGCAPSADAIVAAVKAQAKPGGPLDVKTNTRDGRIMVPHPTTWLNAGRWKDEMAPEVRPSAPAPVPAPAPPVDVEAERAFGRRAVKELIQQFTETPGSAGDRPVRTIKELAVETAKLRALDVADPALAERKRRALENLSEPPPVPETP